MKSEKGVILILTFIIMVTLTAVTVAFLCMTSTQLRGSAYNVRSIEAFWISEGGLQRGIWLIEEGNWSTGFGSGQTKQENDSLGEGTYSITASRAGNTYTINSTGTVGSISRSVQQIFTKQAGQLNPVADSWQET